MSWTCRGPGAGRVVDGSAETVRDESRLLRSDGGCCIRREHSQRELPHLDCEQGNSVVEPAVVQASLGRVEVDAAREQILRNGFLGCQHDRVDLGTPCARLDSQEVVDHALDAPRFGGQRSARLANRPRQRLRHLEIADVSINANAVHIRHDFLQPSVETTRCAAT